MFAQATGSAPRLAAVSVVLLALRIIPALPLDDLGLGGGNAKKPEPLPGGCRAGDNANAFLGGFRLWAKAGHRT